MRRAAYVLALLFLSAQAYGEDHGPPPPSGPPPGNTGGHPPDGGSHPPVMPGGPTFAVLRIVEGDDVTFKVVASRDVEKERKQAVEKAGKAHENWELKRREFLKEKSRKSADFPDPEPAPAVATKARDNFPDEDEAMRFAEKEQRKADGPCVVVKVVQEGKEPVFEALYERKLKAFQDTIAQKHRQELSAWEDRNASSPSPEGKPEKPKVTVLRRDLPDLEAADRARAELGKEK